MPFPSHLQCVPWANFGGCLNVSPWPWKETEKRRMRGLRLCFKRCEGMEKQRVDIIFFFGGGDCLLFYHGMKEIIIGTCSMCSQNPGNNGNVSKAVKALSLLRPEYWQLRIKQPLFVCWGQPWTVIALVRIRDPPELNSHGFDTYVVANTVHVWHISFFSSNGLSYIYHCWEIWKCEGTIGCTLTAQTVYLWYLLCSLRILGDYNPRDFP